MPIKLTSLVIFLSFAFIHLKGQETLIIKNQAGDTLFIVESTGKVGIGESEPTYMLDVGGEIKSNAGGFRFPDGSLQATAASTLGMVPIGSIVAWHKSYNNTPSLPSGWVECNGQFINDIDSPYNGQRAPGINLSELFLRGGLSSGTYQNDEFKSHTHDIDVYDRGHRHSMKKGGDHGSSNDHFFQSTHSSAPEHLTSVAVADIVATLGSTGGTETRPKNMSVVWIMRIK